MSRRVDLLNGNILSALTRLALPLMGTSLLQMAYNMTDMMWIGRIGAGAVASVGAAGTDLWFCTGLLSLARIGGQIRVAHNIGAGDMNKAAEYAKTAIHIALGICFLCAIASVFFTSTIIGVFGLNSPQVITDAENYLKIAGGLMVFTGMVQVLTPIITTTGNSRTPFIATTIGLVFNIILDPILIFGLGPIPAMGVIGAAIATVFSQMIVFSLIVYYMMKDTHLFCLMKCFTISKREYVMDILKLSAPSTLQNVLFPSISMAMSRIVTSFGDNAIAAQRVGSQIESISWLTADGFSMALNSFVAQNWGAGNIRRAQKGCYTAFALMFAWGIFASLVLIFGASFLFKLFIQEPEVLPIGVDYLVILGYSQLFMCMEIITTGAFNGLGKTVTPSVINIILTGLRIPVALVLSASVLALSGVWWTITLSSILKGVILLAAFFAFNIKLNKMRSANIL